MNMETNEVLSLEAKQFKTKLDTLLKDYEDVFIEPTSLPPNREHVHEIMKLFLKMSLCL